MTRCSPGSSRPISGDLAWSSRATLPSRCRRIGGRCPAVATCAMPNLGRAGRAAPAPPRDCLVGVGTEHAAQLPRRRGGGHTVAHHVADRDPDRPIGQGKQVIPVAADLRLLSADQVAGRAGDTGQGRRVGAEDCCGVAASSYSRSRVRFRRQAAAVAAAEWITVRRPLLTDADSSSNAVDSSLFMLRPHTPAPVHERQRTTASNARVDPRRPLLRPSADRCDRPRPPRRGAIASH